MSSSLIVQIGHVGKLVLLSALVATASSGAAAASSALASPTQPTNVSAFHRDGQTFLTWSQSVDTAVDRYRIYRHDAPITAGNLGSATMIWEGWEGSGDFHSDRYYRPVADEWEGRYHDRYVIQELGPELPADQELLVWTIRDSDLGGLTAQDTYYAVAAVDSIVGENTTDFNADNTFGPVSESVGTPSPVRTKAIVGGKASVYIQYADCRDLNVTFNAPNDRNLHYGLDPQAPEIANANAYAFTYVIFSPDTSGCGGPGPFPTMVILHGHGGNTIRPMLSDPDPTWCPAYRIYPLDAQNTWWFGYARDHDYRVDLDVPPTDTIVNYTEQRVLRMVGDLSRDPLLGGKFDSERVYLQGHSMGGSGTLSMALRYPDVFAAAHASQPMTDYAMAGTQGGFDWKPDLETMWGGVNEGIPVASDGPEGLADHLKTFDGTPVWDWQDHQQTLVDRRGDDFVPFGIDHGLQDLTIEWSTQGAPVYAPLDDSLACWAGEVQDALHQPSGLSTIPMPLAQSGQLPFFGFQALLSETVVGMGDFSDDPALPPTSSGVYADSVTWSTSWDPWDGAPNDTAKLWRASLRSTDGGSRTVDVTPRRLQTFAVEPGAEYVWSNESIATGQQVASGFVVADADGLLVVDDFQVTAAGNRLTIRLPFATSVTDSISVSAGGSQAMSLWATQEQAGNFYVILGSLSGTGPGTPFGSQLIPLNIDGYFNFTLVDPYSGPIQNAFSVLDADGRASASFMVPAGSDPSLAGLTAHHAFLTIDPLDALSIDVISNPVVLELVP